MISLFPAMRAGEVLFYVLNVVLAFGLRAQGFSDLVCILVLLLGGALVTFVARMAAYFKHQRIVAILYSGLDPEQFIRYYEPLMKKAAKKPNLEATVRNFLSTGYAAKGDFDKALQLLEETPEPTGNQVMRGKLIQQTNICNLYLLKGDVSAAEALLRKLETQAADIGSEGEDEQLRKTLGTLRVYVQVARGWPTDEKLLKNLATKSTEAYFQVTNLYQLALAQLHSNQVDEAEKNLEKVATVASKMVVGREAARELADLAARREGKSR